MATEGGILVLKAHREGGRLYVALSGEIDHCAAEGLRQELERLLADRSITVLALDFSHVSFMDSSGVGMMIGRYKTMAARGGRVTACGLVPPVDRLFHMAGLHRIIAVEDAHTGRYEQR